MDDLWIMLIDSTNYLSRNGIESTSTTIDRNGKICYTKRIENCSQEASTETKRHQGQLSQIQMRELHELTTNIKPNTPDLLWEGVVTDSSPATLSIFNNGQLLRSNTFYDHQLHETPTNPKFGLIFKLITLINDAKNQTLNNRTT